MLEQCLSLSRKISTVVRCQPLRWKTSRPPLSVLTGFHYFSAVNRAVGRFRALLISGSRCKFGFDRPVSDSKFYVLFTEFAVQYK
jgi:hypothetical protein